MSNALDLTDPNQFGFPNGSMIYGCPSDVRREIIQASHRIQGPAAFRRFWDRVLTQAERDNLGGDMSTSFSQRYAPYFLVECRDYSLEQAIIEIAYKLGFLKLQTYEFLLCKAGVELSHYGGHEPTWDRNSGRLEYRGTLARKIRVAVAGNLVAVLDKFERRQWPRSIENPIESTDPQRIHEVASSLNDNLTGLRFRVENHRICWEPAISQ